MRACAAASWASPSFSRAHDWFADARALALFSHWITPPSEPRRYNTHFFFAVAPPDQAALADAFETHDGMWIAPGDALARYRAASCISSIRRSNISSVWARSTRSTRRRDFARSKPIVTIMPDDSGDDFAIPPRLEGAW